MTPRPRCPQCFKRLDPEPYIHICPAAGPPQRRARQPRPKDPTPRPKDPTPPTPRRRQEPRKASPNAPSRDQYLSAVASPHGTKRRYQHGPAAEGFERSSGGCGCLPCKEANYAGVKRYRERHRAQAAT